MVAPLGRIYTPTALAERLAVLALEGWSGPEPPRVCDPACGDGRLLRAVRARSPEAGLFGADLDPVALDAARAALGPEAELAAADALDRPWEWGGFDIVVANPPWVSFSGRHAAPLAPARRRALRERFELFRSWPSLHAAFVQLAVDLARWRVAILLPAQVCDLDRYAPVRAYLRAHGRVHEPATPLGEDAFDGVTQPSCLVVLDRAERPADLGGHPIPLGDGERAPAFLASLPRPPRGLFADMGVHTGNCARRLIGDVGDPVREGRDLAPYALAAPRRRFRADYAAEPGEYFRCKPLPAYRAIPIVLRQTASHPIAALHVDPGYFRNSVLACRGLPGVDDAVLVAWLNHPLVRDDHRARVRESGQRAFPQLKIRHLQDLPLPDLGAAPADVVRLAHEVARKGRIELRPELDAALARYVASRVAVPGC